jgi:quinol monooxygenase YgiN
MPSPEGEIVSAATFTVRPEHRKELMLTISSLLELIRGKEGCRSYRFYAEDGDVNSFLLVGEWETREAWDEHLKSDHFAVLLGSLRLLSSQPAIDFKLLSHQTVIEAMTRARCEPMEESQAPIFIN